jgi:hypothetical protein
MSLTLAERDAAFKTVLDERGDELYLAIITDDKLNHLLPQIANSNDGSLAA